MLKQLFAFLLCSYSTFLFAQTDTAGTKKTGPITWKDVASWRYINTQNVTLSPDGKWVAYPMITTEGDGELIVKKIGDTIERKYPIGGVLSASFSFSEDGKWIAFKESAAFKEIKAAAKTPGKQLFDQLHLVQLSTGKVTVFEKAGNFSFNGKAASYLALITVKEKAPAAKPDDPKSSDLLILELASGKVQNIGNAGEFSFNKPGIWLAYTIAAADKTGNGLYLFSTLSRVTTVLDNDKMIYRSLGWKEEGDAFAVLKMSKDEKYKTEKGIVLGVKDLDKTPTVIQYDPAKDSLVFPKGSTVSGNRQPYWSDDLTRLFFGITALKPEKKDGAAAPNAISAKDSTGKSAAARPVSTESVKIDRIKTDTSIKTIEDLKKAIARLDSAKTKPDAKSALAKEDNAKPDMTIWNWLDRRLQSRQLVEETGDKDFSYFGMYEVGTSKFVRLNDSTLHDLTLLPKQLYALGEDQGPYELDANLDGQSYEDLYLVDLQTHTRSKWLSSFYQPTFTSSPRPSPDGKKLIYGKDGNFYVYDIAEKSTVNLTEKLPVSFIDTENDHNVIKPLTPVIGWSSDSKFVLVRDLWDIWQIPVKGREAAVNLTMNGRSTRTRYAFRYSLNPEEKGIDLTKPVYIATYGEWTKKSGIVRILPGKEGLKPGIESLLWEDVTVASLNKSKNAEVYVFSREDFNKAPEFFTGDAQLKDAQQETHNTPDAKKYTWSAGTQLVNYVSDKGDTLQGALFLPAGYEKGKKYPTLVYYYEKLSQTLHNYPNPGYSRTGWNPAMYTSNGYAVFIPDIVYKINDPGMSAVWCVLPGVKAAIATGIVDENNIGIHGHSWGGYQTAFLVTQTHQFKAAAAGAPLTDLISMYDLIYWNTGLGNMAIFEASQGRFTGGPWENWEAYHRNSPIYHVKDVTTPLLMLHNDKDGAVDFTQGIEYYSALRRLKKPVVMITYKGENHGLAKPENRRDYSIRMMEFFDHYLKGKPLPDWYEKGVDRLNMEEHLDARTMGASPAGN